MTFGSGVDTSATSGSVHLYCTARALSSSSLHHVFVLLGPILHDIATRATILDCVAARRKDLERMVASNWVHEAGRFRTAVGSLSPSKEGLRGVRHEDRQMESIAFWVDPLSSVASGRPAYAEHGPVPDVEDRLRAVYQVSQGHPQLR